MPTTTGAAAPRIAVSTFDAVEQTRLWLELGPEAATRTMLGALRTALLLGDTLVLDRNQVMEGIFFVAMPPDRLAWHLGLPPGAPLPLTVGLLGTNVEPLPPPGRATRWPTSTGEMWGVDDELASHVDRNYAAVVADPLRVSSPLVAITGQYDASTDGAVSVNAPRPGTDWDRTDPEFVPQEVWDRRGDPALARHLIEEGRAAWAHAMKVGRVRLERLGTVPIDLGRALEAAPVRDPRVLALARALLRLEETSGGRTCELHHAWIDDEPAERCGRRHATGRSRIVRWLDGEEVPELEPSAMNADLVATYDLEDRTAAFHWWVAAYYDGIRVRDELRLLTLHDVGADHHDDAWGLTPRATSRWESLRRRLLRRSPGGRDITIEGELVEHLMDFSPGQFSALQRLKVVDVRRLWSDPPDGRALFGLALAVRELAGDHVSRGRRMLVTSLRWIALTCLAVMFALRDEKVVQLNGGAWTGAFVVLAVVAAFPYAETAALLRMSRGRLGATLRIREQP